MAAQGGLFFLWAGGVTYTLTAGQGSFTETGEAALFKVDMVEAQGSFALTGEAALFKADMSLAFGSFAETGEAALFRADMVEAFGSFVETGRSIVLKPELLASYASFVETGENIAFAINPGIVDTSDDLQLPINCVLAGQQLIRDRYRENTLFDPGLKATRKIEGVSVQIDRTGRFAKPGFTVTTNNRGYD